jgi:hypothetical protein
VLKDPFVAFTVVKDPFVALAVMKDPFVALTVVKDPFVTSTVMKDPFIAAHRDEGPLHRGGLLSSVPVPCGLDHAGSRPVRWIGRGVSMKSLLAGALAVAASLSFLPAASAAPAAVSPAAPYLFLGWGEPPSPSAVMEATGVRSFTMAFVLSDGGCSPAWDGSRPLTGGADQAAIDEIRAAGGDIVPSFGGWSGNKLGPNCESPEALAAAYQEVIDAYGLSAIDIDIENTDEFENATVQDRILNALKIVKANNPGLRTILTFGTSTTGPTYWGNRLIEQANALNANIDVFTIMPFDFGGGADMYGNTVNATEGLKTKLKSTFGWDDATAYAHIGISGMNGLSDQQELTSPATWTSIRDWANSHHIARLAFWSVNRDRPCAGGGVVSNCSGISQSNWQFTSITAGFTG